MVPASIRTTRNAFCLVRPPGHHVGRFGRTGGCCSHGFCLLNNVAIGATKARVDYGCKKIAIIDFDVHFGNGTYEIFRNDKDTLFVSVHMTGDGEGNIFFGANLPGVNEINHIDNNICVSIDGGKQSKGRKRFSGAFLGTVLPALKKFNPELILISAGFDGHRDDPLGGHLGKYIIFIQLTTNQVVKLLTNS
jgi:acetoin utilization deacetylase AcuC-like enzyme